MPCCSLASKEKSQTCNSLAENKAMIEVEKILQDCGVSPTPVRKLVYKCLIDADRPLSLADIETLLDSVDKSTISRTLLTFKKNMLLHAFNDGSGSTKYEVCKDHADHDTDSDRHVHFRCEKCGTTICFTSIPVPKVDLPPDFLVKDINYLVSGLCNNCCHEC